MKFFSSAMICLSFMAAHGQPGAKGTGCLREREKRIAQQSRTDPHSAHVVECSPDGKYAEVQGDGFFYWCVDPETGKKRSETLTQKVKPDCSVGRKIDCEYVKAKEEAESSSGKRRVSVSCKPDGSYNEKQCHEISIENVYCWCVHPDSGLIQSGTLTNGRDLECNKNSNQTSPTGIVGPSNQESV